MVSFSLETSSHGPGALNEKPAVHSPIMSTTCDLRGTFKTQRLDFNLEYRKQFLLHHCFGPFLLQPCHPPEITPNMKRTCWKTKLMPYRTPCLSVFIYGLLTFGIAAFFSLSISIWDRGRDQETENLEYFDLCGFMWTSQALFVLLPSFLCV